MYCKYCSGEAQEKIFNPTEEIEENVCSNCYHIMTALKNDETLEKLSEIAEKKEKYEELMDKWIYDAELKINYEAIKEFAEKYNLDIETAKLVINDFIGECDYCGSMVIEGDEYRIEKNKLINGIEKIELICENCLEKAKNGE